MLSWPGLVENNRLNKFIRRISEEDALDALIRYRRHEINEDAMCTVCWPYIGRVALAVSFRFRKGIDRDDLQSELWLIFADKIINEYNEKTGPLTPYVARYAHNICHNMLRHRNRVEYFEHDVMLDYFGNLLDYSTSFDADEFDRKRALAKISEKLANRGVTGYDALMNKKTPIPGFIAPDTKVKNADKGGVPSKRKIQSGLVTSCKDIHKELRGIRLSLGYSQAMMADCLGIGVPRYASYEYGRTSGIPDEIMDAARAELDLDGGEVSQLKQRFDLPMGDIVRRWVGMVDDCDYKKLSAICGVSLSTVHRWAMNKTRPSLAILNRYESMVIEWVSIMRKKATVA